MSDTVSKRQWVVPAAFVDDDGRWEINPHAEAMLDDLLSDIGTILTRIGGTIGMVTERARIGDGPDDFLTLRYLVRWEAFAPSEDLREPLEPPAPPPTQPEQPQPEPVDEIDEQESDLRAAAEAEAALA